MDAEKYFPTQIRQAVSKIIEAHKSRINEYRFRVCRPLAVLIGNEIKYLSHTGELTYSVRNNTIIITQGDITGIFDSICQYSVHSFRREIADGFITVEGGHRVGICGSAVVKTDVPDTVKHISGLNFRIARQVLNCSDDIYGSVFSNGLCNMLIAGGPGSGKTTVLRDLCRNLGGRYKLSVIDERSEIAAVHNGIPQNDVGINTDVFNGYSKECGIKTAVRVMSPQVIVCDEIGNKNDSEALFYAYISGVKIIATVHASGINDIVRKDFDYALFDYIALLSCEKAGQINKIIRTDEIVKDNRMRAAGADYGDARELLFSGT